MLYAPEVSGATKLLRLALPDESVTVLGIEIGEVAVNDIVLLANGALIVESISEATTV
jgi:hypothetical protein